MHDRLVEESPEVAVVLDPDLVVRYASPAIGRVLGLKPDDVLGDELSLHLHPEDGAKARDALSRPARGERRLRRELRIRHANGSWRWFEATVIDLLDDPRVGGIAVYLRDVTVGRRLKNRLVYRAFHDALTGLANRTLFKDRLRHGLARAERNREPLAVLFVDLDDFKAINDGLGHEAGDRLLVAVGRRLESALRPGDTVARLGGDEFAVLLEGGGEASGVTRTAGRLLRALKDPISLEGLTLSVTASIGGAIGGPGDGEEELLRRADAVMYRAKRAGKDRFELFDGGGPSGPTGRSRYERDLERALEGGELGIHFQPEVALGSGKIVGMEALLRWDYPWRSRTSPREIVALAERTGLMGAVGR